MDPADRTLRARLAAHVSHANTLDPASRTAKARAAANERFVKAARELHPDATEEQIARVAEHLRKAHYARMGMASAAKRRKGARPEAA
jgi:predicted negative regulator of RcsB-dependent stress response